MTLSQPALGTARTGRPAPCGNCAASRRNTSSSSISASAGGRPVDVGTFATLPAADDVNVGDGLGWQAGDRGAADALDPLGERAESPCDLAAQLGEGPGPAGIVIGYLHWRVQRGSLSGAGCCLGRRSG